MVDLLRLAVWCVHKNRKSLAELPDQLQGSHWHTHSHIHVSILDDTKLDGLGRQQHSNTSAKAPVSLHASGSSTWFKLVTKQFCDSRFRENRVSEYVVAPRLDLPHITNTALQYLLVG